MSNNDEIINQVISAMEGRGYSKVRKGDYHREKKEYAHTCSKIGKEYNYFINFNKPIGYSEGYKKVKEGLNKISNVKRRKTTSRRIKRNEY